MASENLQKFLDEIRDLPEFVGIGEEFAGATTRGLLGETPLHVAATRGDAPVVAELLNEGADIDAQGEYGHTPLHQAVGQGHIETVRLLLSKGASPLINNDWGQTALDVAKIGDRHEIESLLSKAR